MPLTIPKGEYPYLYEVLAMIWIDNIPELDIPDPFTIKTPGNWNPSQANMVLGTLTSQERETFAFGEYEERQALVKSKKDIGHADDMVETFFEELL